MKEPIYRIIEETMDNRPCYFIQEFRSMCIFGIRFGEAEWRIPSDVRLKCVGFIRGSGASYSYYKKYDTMEQAITDINNENIPDIKKTVWINFS